MYKIKSAISFSIALIILSGIFINILTFNVNGYTANALSTTTNSSSLSSSQNTLLNDSNSNSSVTNNNNNNTVANVSKQYQQQLSSATHTREYTLIAENTTLEI